MRCRLVSAKLTFNHSAVLSVCIHWYWMSVLSMLVEALEVSCGWISRRQKLISVCPFSCLFDLGVRDEVRRFCPLVWSTQRESILFCSPKTGTQHIRWGEIHLTWHAMKWTPGSPCVKLLSDVRVLHCVGESSQLTAFALKLCLLSVIDFWIFEATVKEYESTIKVLYRHVSVCTHVYDRMHPEHLSGCPNGS